jgi:hypothetical protein
MTVFTGRPSPIGVCGERFLSRPSSKKVMLDRWQSLETVS